MTYATFINNGYTLYSAGIYSYLILGNEIIIQSGHAFVETTNTDVNLPISFFTTNFLAIVSTLTSKNTTTTFPIGVYSDVGRTPASFKARCSTKNNITYIAIGK